MKNSSIILTQLEKLIGVVYNQNEVKEHFNGYTEINDTEELSFNQDDNLICIHPQGNFDTVFYIELEENLIMGVWAE